MNRSFFASKVFIIRHLDHLKRWLAAPESWINKIIK